MYSHYGYGCGYGADVVPVQSIVAAAPAIAAPPVTPSASPPVTVSAPAVVATASTPPDVTSPPIPGVPSGPTATVPGVHTGIHHGNANRGMICIPAVFMPW